MAAYAWLQVSSFHLADNTSLPAAPEKKFSPVAVLESPRGDQKVPTASCEESKVWLGSARLDDGWPHSTKMTKPSV